MLWDPFCTRKENQAQGEDDSANGRGDDRIKLSLDDSLDQSALELPPFLDFLLCAAINLSVVEAV